MSEELFLHSVAVVASSENKPVRKPVHHVLAIDCSGSMAGDLPRMRKQLSEKLVTLLGEDDLLSLVWFSGRGEAGVVFEGRAVPNLRSLDETRKVLERWLRPIGLTGFVDPLGEVAALVERVGPSYSHSLFFLTDGCDNQSRSRTDIMAMVRRAALHLSAATFVEYGYYADRALLTEMAVAAGGCLVFAEHFENYAPRLEDSVLGIVPDRRVAVTLPVDAEPIHGQVFALGSDQKIYTFEVRSAVASYEVLVPEGLASKVFWLSTKRGGAPLHGFGRSHDFAPLYAAAYIYMQIGRTKVVREVLRAIGDVALLTAFTGCYGKQKHTEVMEMARMRAFVPELQFVLGRSEDYRFDKYAITIVDLLSLLQMNGSEVSVLLDSSDFEYSKISRARLDAADLLDDGQRAEVEKLTQKIAETRDVVKMRALVAELDALQESLGLGGLKFRSDNKPAGYSVLDLTWNENRPNVSMLVRRTGTVDLTGRIPEALAAKIPVNFPTFVFRNYALVRDGMINVSTLPVLVMNRGVLELLREQLGARLEVVSYTHPTNSRDAGWGCRIDLRGMPVVNDWMVESVDCKGLLDKQYALQAMRCRQKVLKDYKKGAVAEHLAENLVERYGVDGAEWLASVGIGRNGFAPVSTKQAPVRDFYMGIELEVNLKGLMTLPSVNEVRKRMTLGKKLAGAAELMATCISEVEDKKNALAPEAFSTWIEEETERAIALTRGLIRDVARTKYAVVLGQTWFPEFPSFGEGECRHRDIDCSLKLVDVEIAV